MDVIYMLGFGIFRLSKNGKLIILMIYLVKIMLVIS